MIQSVCHVAEVFFSLVGLLRPQLHGDAFVGGTAVFEAAQGGRKAAVRTPRYSPVSRIFTSWNQTAAWLRQVEDLRKVA
jgi:hypothetical protein